MKIIARMVAAASVVVTVAVVVLKNLLLKNYFNKQINRLIFQMLNYSNVIFLIFCLCVNMQVIVYMNYYFNYLSGLFVFKQL